MCDKTEFEVCRLCLSSRGLLVNVFGENSKLQIMLENTIEDLIDFKVVQDKNYPWLVCSNCMEKLTEFRLFKRRCTECLSVFYNRTQKGCNLATNDRITNQEEFPIEIKDEISDAPIVSDIIDQRDVDVPDDMMSVKEEIDAASGCFDSPVRDVEPLTVASVREGCSHWSDNEEAGNLDHSEDDKLYLSFNEEVDIKEEWDINVPQEGVLRADMSQEQDDGQGQDGAGREGGQGQYGAGNLIHECQFCNEVFKQRELLKAHFRHMHLETEGQLGCDDCCNVFECRSDLDEHVKSVHTVGRKFQCHQCYRHFLNLSQLKTHMSTHTSDLPFKSEMCSKAFNRNVHLKNHMLAYIDENPFKCHICLKGFAQSCNLKRHMIAHTDERPYACDICSKTYSAKLHLRNHMVSHTAEKPFKCEICLKGFALSCHLKRHLVAHANEKSFVCDICSEAFSTKVNLTNHMYAHTGVKPYKCHICFKTFARNNYLNQHMLTHTVEKTYHCHICFKTFILKQQLERHFLGHTIQRPHKCEICSTEFKRKGDLVKHKKVKRCINKINRPKI